MRCRTWILTLILSSVMALPAGAQAPGPAAPGAQPSPAGLGYRFSDALLQTIVKRWAFDLGDAIDLDADQEQAVRRALADRWVPFLREHQDELAPLLERYVQAMIDPEPPSDAAVEVWAGQALDLQNKLLEQYNHSEAEIAQLLRPEQLGRFRAETTKIRVGFGAFNSQVTRWQAGDYPHGFWEKQLERRTARRAANRERQAGEQTETALRALSLSEWDAYVEAFIKTFELDAAQATSAGAALSEAKSRARAYIEAHAEDISRLRRQLTSDDPVQREAALAQTAQATALLEQMFDDLKNRLGTIPTEAQREQAQHRAPAETDG